MGGGDLLGSSMGRRGLVALTVVAVLALALSAGAGASVVRDGVRTAALAASCGSDEFEGAALDDARWAVLRPAGDGLTVGGGKLNLTLRNGDLIGGTANAENVVLQEAPAGGWTATTKLNTAAINAPGEQAGLVLWRNEGAGQNAFGKVMFLQLDAATRVVEAIWTERSGQAVPAADSRAAIPAALPADADVLLRMRYDGARVTAELSLDDGATWTQAGQTARYAGPLRVGVMAVQGASGNGGVVPFERFNLECAPQVTASVPSGPAPLQVNFTSTADGAWDFGDGQTATGQTVSHTFTEPGTYRVRQTVSGRVTGSTVVTVQPAQAPALPQSDEFNGNELDPKWEVLRPRHTGIAVSGGHLRLQQYSGDMHGGSASATNVLLQNAPEGCAWSATTRLDVAGMTATGDQAGLILWRGETPYFNFSKIVFNRRGADSWWVERSNTVGGAAQGTTNTAITGGVPPQVYIRVNVAADGTVQPERSTDGTTWTPVGGSYSVADAGPLKVGLVFMGANSSRRAAFDYFRVASQGPCEPPPPCPQPQAEEGFSHIWNGRTLDGWRQAGSGTFALVNDGAEGCRLESRGGLGLLWYELAQYDDFVLRLQFKTADDTDNSGVFVRFPNPGTDANIPINQGHEVQIYDGTTGEPQKTGSIYNLDPADVTGVAKPPGQWNDYEIKYEDNSYTITLNGQVINTWTPAADQRRVPGHIGLQNHGDGDRVSFRNIRIRHIGEPYQPNLFTTFGITSSGTRQNSEIRGNPPYSLPAEEMPPSGTRGPAPEDTFDEVPLRMPDTSGNVRNFAAFRGQSLPLRPADQRTYSKIHFFGTTSDGNGGGDFVLRFSDGTHQIVPVAFSDWCAPSNTPGHHVAIGPLSQRYRTTGSDGARCAIYHVPADVTPGKTLVSVTLPRGTTSGSGANRQAYLMALTLEEPSGGFRSPDLSGQVQFADDQTSPVSQHTVSPGTPTGGGGWYTEPVTVTLSAADEAGGSGLQRIQYRVNGGVPQDYTAPVQITADGESRFEYRAIDVAGNAEGYKALPIKVDRTAPATTIRVEPEAPRGTGTWDDRPATVTITARDGSGSGVAVTELHFGDGNWQPYTGPISLNADGRYDLHVRSSDVAGNDEGEQTMSIGIDQTAPTSSAQLTSAQPRGGGVHRAPVTVTLAAGDAQSGVAALEYRLDGGQWQPYTGPFTVSALGGHLLEHRARDHAGNLENAKEAAFAIGSAPQTGSPGGDDSPLPPEPFVGLMPVDRLAVGALVRKGLRVRASCVAVGRGTLALTVTRKVARRLGLGRKTTLATRSVRCGDESRISVSLKPSRRVKRALRRADGSFVATLRLRMNGIDGPASDSEKLTLRG